MPQDVSIIGLGVMGSALAQALVRAGNRVTVWNRSADKAEPLVKQGAILAPSAAAAVAASPVTILCVSGGPATERILAEEGVGRAAAGRVVVQLSTTTPQQARDGQAWAHANGAEYLDGSILAFPAQIGTADATIFVSGPEEAFHRSEAALRDLAGTITYVGEQMGAVSAMDLAVLSYLAANVLGFVHGARIYESEGLPIESYGAMLGDIAPFVGEMIKHQGKAIQAGAYRDPQVAVTTYAAALGSVAQNAREAKINAEYPTFALGLFKRAAEAGYADEEPASLIKVLRAE